MTAVTGTTRARPAGAAAGAPRRGAVSRAVDRFGRGLIQAFLVAVAVFWLVPTFGLFIASLRPESANSSSGWWTVFTAPGQLTVDAYERLLTGGAIPHSFLNTFLITVPSTLLVVIIGSLAAYAFAWQEFPGRDWVFLVVVGLLVVPIQVALIPVAQLFGMLHIFGSIPGVVLFHVAFGLPFAIFLLRNFFVGIPAELLEAARLDGAGELRIFGRVILPLALPALASLTIFQFMWVWNDLLVALVFADSDSAPITVALQSEVRQFGANIDVLAPGAFLSMTVPLIVFFAFQRFFVQGIMAGSVK